MKVSGTSRIFLSVIVILTLLLASCGGGGSDTQGTSEVPSTGQTEAAPGTGAATEAPTAAATEAATEAATAEATGTVEGTAEATQAATGEATTQPTSQGGNAAVGEGPTFTGEKIGGTVTVLVIWGGEELANFEAMLAPFEQQTGIDVQIESTRDLGAVLNTRIQGGNPPDVAGLPNPGQLTELAKQGALKPLDDVVDMQAMQQVYDPGFLKLASVDGKMYGLWTKAAVKSLVWYNPPAFEAAGLTVPKTW